MLGFVRWDKGYCHEKYVYTLYKIRFKLSILPMRFLKFLRLAVFFLDYQRNTPNSYNVSPLLRGVSGGGFSRMYPKLCFRRTELCNAPRSGDNPRRATLA